MTIVLQSPNILTVTTDADVSSARQPFYLFYLFIFSNKQLCDFDRHLCNYYTAGWWPGGC